MSPSRSGAILFCTQEFLLFTLAIFAVYWLLPYRTAKVYWLLGASFYFYATWNEELALVVAGSSTADYLIARGLDRFPSRRWRQVLLAISLGGNLALLAYFKYSNFFIESFRQMLAGAGLETSGGALDIVLPIGISFYTFEAISYTMDVYRRRIPAERSLANFMLFITFFPHMVAGPIVRARAFLPQMRRPKKLNWYRLQVAFGYLVLGLIKKMAISDRMAMIADPVFADPGAFGSGAVWAAILAYSIQIYCDFSGYSDLAMAVAHLFGYTLTFNFDMPYSSANVAEFWRRWHISLSSWLRDYLFIPLGGSRGGGWQTSRNLMITMALGGLWHGASWNFIIWGIAHGAFLIVHRLFRVACQRRPELEFLLRSHLGTIYRIGLTFACVSLAWVLFRAPDLQTASTIYSRAFAFEAGSPLTQPVEILAILSSAVILAHLAGRSGLRKYLYETIPSPIVGIAWSAAAIVAMALAPDAGKAFIYFQF